MHRRSTRLSALAVAFAVVALVATAPAGAGDAGKGKGVFAAQCAMCHSNARNGPTILGPALYGVVGRKAASVAGYAYSPGMKAAAWTWTDDRLTAYLPNPRAMVQGTKMSFGGLKDPTKLADLVAYLDALK